MSTIKSLVRDWLPPAIIRMTRSFRAGGNCFEGDYESWEAAAARCSGYDAEHILAKVLDATLKVKLGEAAYERDSVLFDEIEYVWPVTAGLMWAAARSGGKLDVLDFGGALGSSYFQHRVFLAALPEVTWNVIEQPHYVDVGQKYIQDDTLRFYLTIDDCLKENRPNVVLLSSVLQYLPETDGVIDQIINSQASILIIDRTPFTSGYDDRICIQNVPDWIYKANYPMRIFAEEKFRKMISSHWSIVANNIAPEGGMKTIQGLDLCFQGFLLQRKYA